MVTEVQPTLLYERLDEVKGTCAVIVAAGGFSRMGGIHKQFAPLLDVPVLARTMLAFQRCPEISSLVVVAREEEIPDVQKLAISYEISKLCAIAAGGGTRTASVAAGIGACPDGAAYFAIHDGARPLVTPALIGRTVRKAWETGAAAPAVPVKDTVKFALEGIVQSTPDRRELFAVQTPQVFERESFLRCMERARLSGEEVTDDCQLFERAGLPVHLVPGDYRNIKITTPEDLAIAEALLTLMEGE